MGFPRSFQQVIYHSDLHLRTIRFYITSAKKDEDFLLLVVHNLQ